jgi:hypothetical protein
MTILSSKNYICWLLIFITWSCIEPYTPPPITSANNYLVVDGFINAGQGPTTFTLSRTRNLAEALKPIPESGANLVVEGENGDSYRLAESREGMYSLNFMNLNPASKYRLRIRTTDSKEYLSAFVSLIQTPAIDSITWAPIDNGVQIYVNTHDPTNNTWFYRWDFQETWEYHSAFSTSLIYRNDVMQSRTPEETKIYTCWQNASSTGINLGSSEKLNEDIIYLFPLTIVPAAAKLSVKYSILVRQYGISKETFDYWQLLKKNTETTGSIFDAQPSQLTGNITCVNNPAEPVIGFVSAGSMEEKRIFINRSQLPFRRLTTGYERCEVDTVFNDAKEVKSAFGDGQLIPLYEFYVFGALAYAASDKFCVDCREYGGATLKPDFWE